MPASLNQTLRNVIFGKGQSISYTGTAGVIAVNLPVYAQSVMVWTSTDAYVCIGNSATLAATTSDIPIPAGTPVILPIQRPTAASSDINMRVSAIQISSGGILYVQPLAE